VEKIAEKLKVPNEILIRSLAKVKVLSPEWLVESIKAKKRVPISTHTVEVSIPKKLQSSASSKLDEEEKKDKVVKLEDIMEDVYAMKFGKKRSVAEMENESKVLKKSQSIGDAPTKRSKISESQLTHRSKSFKEGEEILSEDSYLF